MTKAPTEAQARRLRWMLAHQVQYALLLGVPWGLFMGLVWWLLLGKSPLSIIFWLIVGCVFFGPVAARKTSKMFGGRASAVPDPDRRTHGPP